MSSWEIFGLIPMLWGCKQFCFEHYCTCPLGNMARISPGIYFCWVIESICPQHPKSCQTVFQMVIPNCQWCVFLPVAPYPFWFLVLFDISSFGNLMNVKCYPFVILICIFLISNEVKHRFIYLSVNLIYSFMKCLFKSFSQFYVELSFSY